MRVIISALLATLVSTASAFADGITTTTIPTLSERGMIAMVCLLGVIGAIALRKRLISKVG